MKNIGAVSLKLLMTGRKASKFLFMSGFQDPPYSNFVLFRKVIYYCDLLWFLYLSLTVGEKTVCNYATKHRLCLSEVDKDMSTITSFHIVWHTAMQAPSNPIITDPFNSYNYTKPQSTVTMQWYYYVPAVATKTILISKEAICRLIWKCTILKRDLDHIFLKL